MTELPAQNVVGPLALTIGVAAGVMLTVALPLAEQLPLTTATLSCALPLAPTLKVMLVVPCPDVIAPFVMPHEYVAPAVGLTMLATSPVAFGHALAGALIAALGGVHATVTTFENCDVPSPNAESEQPEPSIAVATATILSPVFTPTADVLLLVDAALPETH